ncbi:predicted protein [Chaetomium globosum CBS 148.51]|uniref:Uncharacterized protein n=1 Tax=Chaetomium globosum (strain ATCC 6205 / CBS 148.51 / DSM 1962 / NBRC 6347 / NRRL 1970) TaxID=306901 RepID=Q2H3L7_CHAGB|nr:uncharacterized protein CHGG_06748 [Chaetomium globosum CBS 148.51]EAQ90129.1 predicted protein [Chaetomium globosum CBS 148.51]
MPLPHPVQHDILAAVRGVDVPRHVQPRAEAGDLAEEIGTAGAVDGAAVEVLFGGAQFDKIAARKFGGPRGEYKDNPLYALCRFYEFVALDRNPKNWKTSYSSGPDCQFLAYN